MARTGYLLAGYCQRAEETSSAQPLPLDAIRQLRRGFMCQAVRVRTGKRTLLRRWCQTAPVTNIFNSMIFKI